MDGKKPVVCSVCEQQGTAMRCAVCTGARISEYRELQKNLLHQVQTMRLTCRRLLNGSLGSIDEERHLKAEKWTRGSELKQMRLRSQHLTQYAQELRDANAQRRKALDNRRASLQAMKENLAQQRTATQSASKQQQNKLQEIAQSSAVTQQILLSEIMTVYQMNAPVSESSAQYSTSSQPRQVSAESTEKRSLASRVYRAPWDRKRTDMKSSLVMMSSAMLTPHTLGGVPFNLDPATAQPWVIAYTSYLTARMLKHVALYLGLAMPYIPVFDRVVCYLQASPPWALSTNMPRFLPIRFGSYGPHVNANVMAQGISSLSPTKGHYGKMHDPKRVSSAPAHSKISSPPGPRGIQGLLYNLLYVIWTMDKTLGPSENNIPYLMTRLFATVQTLETRISTSEVSRASFAEQFSHVLDSVGLPDDLTRSFDDMDWDVI